MDLTKHSPTVLVADDDEDDRRFIRRAWETNRAIEELRFVEDGQELTDYLNHSGKYTNPVSAPPPWLILLDLNMPRKDGRQALREIKSDLVLRNIPIVVLTTSEAEQDICRSYELGANSYITKPPTLGGLVDVLQVLGKYWIDTVNLPPEFPICQ